MAKKELRLVPPTFRFNLSERRGIYVDAVKKFVDSNEPELNVDEADKENVYNGLRKAVEDLGLKDKVYVSKRYGEVHLIRME